jgi:hypothetical protein
MDMVGQVSMRRMGPNKALGAKCTIMQLLGGTAYKNPSLKRPYMDTWQPLPNPVQQTRLQTSTL